MRAITYSRYGPPDVLTPEDVPKPVPADDELLIKVRAVEATKSDCEMRSFRFSVSWFWLPLRLALGIRAPRRRILGGYFAGEIEAVGKCVEDFFPGDQVFGAAQLRLGGYAEYMTIPARFTVVGKPHNMTFVEAAAVPLGGLNALHFMGRANIRPGDQILINGAGGSIGTHAVQIAKAMGAEVTAVDRADKSEGLRALGADHFIDYTTQDFAASGLSYDVVFDMVPSSEFAACMRVLKPRGRYLSGNARLSTIVRSLVTNLVSNRTASFALARETREELQTLKKMIEAGQIGSIVDRVYPLAHAADAHRQVEAEQRVGAVVIEIDGS